MGIKAYSLRRQPLPALRAAKVFVATKRSKKKIKWWGGSTDQRFRGGGESFVRGG
jgi:hypothetical protein